MYFTLLQVKLLFRYNRLSTHNSTLLLSWAVSPFWVIFHWPLLMNSCIQFTYISFQALVHHENTRWVSRPFSLSCYIDVHTSRYAHTQTTSLPEQFPLVSLCSALIIKAICPLDPLHEKSILLAAMLLMTPASYFMTDRGSRSKLKVTHKRLEAQISYYHISFLLLESVCLILLLSIMEIWIGNCFFFFSFSLRVLCFLQSCLDMFYELCRWQVGVKTFCFFFCFFFCAQQGLNFSVGLHTISQIPVNL